MRQSSDGIKIFAKAGFVMANHQFCDKYRTLTLTSGPVCISMGGLNGSLLPYTRQVEMGTWSRCSRVEEI